MIHKYLSKHESPSDFVSRYEFDVDPINLALLSLELDSYDKYDTITNSNKVEYVIDFIGDSFGNDLDFNRYLELTYSLIGFYLIPYMIILDDELNKLIIYHVRGRYNAESNQCKASQKYVDRSGFLLTTVHKFYIRPIGSLGNYAIYKIEVSNRRISSQVLDSHQVLKDLVTFDKNETTHFDTFEDVYSKIGPI